MRLYRLGSPRFLMDLARIKHSKDFEGFQILLEETQKQLDQGCRKKTGAELFRDQGAAQVIEELKELFDNIEEIVDKTREQ